MNKKNLSGFIALTDIDDGFISEALDEKKPRRRWIPTAAAAAAVLTAAVTAFLFFRVKPDERTAALDASPVPTQEIPSTDAPIHTPFETAIPTEETTDTPSVSPTFDATEPPTDTETPTPGASEPVHASPTLSAEPSVSTTPGPTPGPSPSPTPAQSPTPTPTPISTPRPTLPPSEPTPTPAPTAPPSEPSAEPTESYGQSFFYYSLESFLNAVHNHEHPALNGLTEYYVPSRHEGLVLSFIIGDYETLTFSYRDMSGRNWDFIWYRTLPESELYVVAAGHSGEWHGSHYVLSHGTNPNGLMRVYWAQHGYLFSSVMPVSEEGMIESFCDSERNYV